MEADITFLRCLQPKYKWICSEKTSFEKGVRIKCYCHFIFIFFGSSTLFEIHRSIQSTSKKIIAQSCRQTFSPDDINGRKNCAGILERYMNNVCKNGLTQSFLLGFYTMVLASGFLVIFKQKKTIEKCKRIIFIAIEERSPTTTTKFVYWFVSHIFGCINCTGIGSSYSIIH